MKAIAWMVWGLPLVATAAGLDGYGQAMTAFKAGKTDAAIAQFYELAEHAPDSEVRQSSEYYLGEALAKANLPVAAAIYEAQVFKQGPKHPFYAQSVASLVELQRRLKDPFLIPTVIGTEFQDSWSTLPQPVVSRLNYLLGTTRYRSMKLGDAASYLSAVKPESDVYAKARYLLGVVYADPRFPGGAQPEKALQAFGEVVALRSAQEDLEQVRDLARLGQGRVYYGMKQYANASKAYEQVPRFSRYWDQALFENGFARFRNDDYGGALGSLQALHAPQFEGAFQPESWLLKATVYYFSCLYDEAATAMKAFAQIYVPMADQMKALTDNPSQDLGAYFQMVNDPKDTRLPRQVKLWVRNNERIAGLFSLLDEIDREKAVLGRSGTSGAELAGYLDQNRQTVVQTAGQLVKNRLVEATENIRKYTNDGALIRFETTIAQKKLLEKGVDQRKLLADQRLYRPAIPSEAWNYWKFEGEFWIDEIGYYQYTLKRGCPDDGAEASVGGSGAQQPRAEHSAP